MSITGEELVMAILAADARRRRQQRSEQMKAALAWAKARGVKLGGPNIPAIASLGAQANREKADQFAADVMPIIRQIQRDGAHSLRAVAAALSRRGIRTPRGGTEWGPATVARVIARAPA